MLIRPATLADVPALLTIESGSATAAHWSPATYEGLFTQSAPARLVLVASEKHQVLGFLVALCAGPEWEIENVVVSPSALRCGIASSLLRELLAQARAAAAETVFLEVRESNHPARGLYEKFLFTEAGRRRAYYSDPLEGAVVYQLALSTSNPLSVLVTND